MLKDYYLKFASKEEAAEVFSSIPDHTFTNPETEEVTISQGNGTFAIDEVGVIYNDDAVYETNEETGEITLVTPATAVEGYHYNYRIVFGNHPEIPLPEELQPYAVEPNTPSRVWF
jgi:hypothetical protein